MDEKTQNRRHANDLSDQHFLEPAIDLNDRTVLVTGGTGSFGKHFVKTVIARFKPKKLIIFSRDELKRGCLDVEILQSVEDTIVFGAVAIVREALVRAHRPEPANIDFPIELMPYVGRRLLETTMCEVRNWEQHNSPQLPAHVKPRDRQKLFKGAVVRSFRDMIPLSGVSDDEPVIVQEVVDFVSEWRATILRRKIVNVANYKGNPIRFPDEKVLAKAVCDWSSQPIGCGMDWGVTADGRTLLVEVNDGFSLGNYGVRGHQYTAMIECRWRELMGLSDNGVGEDFA